MSWCYTYSYSYALCLIVDHYQLSSLVVTESKLVNNKYHYYSLYSYSISFKLKSF